MTRRPRRLVAAALSLASPAAAQERVLSLSDALALARDRAPALAAERASVAAVRGERIASGYLLPEEPVLELEAAPRTTAGAGTTTDLGFTLSQRFEIGGQRGRRVARATRLAEAAAADLGAFERDYLAAVASAYLAAAAARERLDLAARAESWGREADAAAALRHDSGDIALLDRNLAAIELSRLEAERWRAESEAAVAQLELVALLGTEGDATARLSTLDEAVQQLGQAGDAGASDAASRRQELAAARARVGAQQAEVSLLRAERAPDIVATVGRGREEATDRWTRFGIAVSLPLLRRNRGEIVTASAELERRLAALEVTRLQVERELGQALSRKAAVAGALDALGPGTRARLEQNLALATESFEAGKIGLVELLFVRRSGLEANRLLLDARLDYGHALIEARRAAGLPPIGP